MALTLGIDKAIDSNAINCSTECQQCSNAYNTCKFHKSEYLVNAFDSEMCGDPEVYFCLFFFVCFSSTTAPKWKKTTTKNSDWSAGGNYILSAKYRV